MDSVQVRSYLWTGKYNKHNRIIWIRKVRLFLFEISLPCIQDDFKWPKTIDSNSHHLSGCYILVGSLCSSSSNAHNTSWGICKSCRHNRAVTPALAVANAALARLLCVSAGVRKGSTVNVGGCARARVCVIIWLACEALGLQILRWIRLDTNVDTCRYGLGYLQIQTWIRADRTRICADINRQIRKNSDIYTYKYHAYLETTDEGPHIWFKYGFLLSANPFSPCSLSWTLPSHWGWFRLP